MSRPPHGPSAISTTYGAALAVLVAGMAVASLPGLVSAQAAGGGLSMGTLSDVAPAADAPVGRRHLEGLVAETLVGAVDAIGRLDETARARLINRVVNASVAYRSDLENWGEEDYWATPEQTLQTRIGDCEDYAILKYYLLARAGVPIARLRIVVARLRDTDQSHAVLVVLPLHGGAAVVLDNTRDNLDALAERDDLVPVYSFNHFRVWRGGADGEVIGSPVRLRKWREMSRRFTGTG